MANGIDNADRQQVIFITVVSPATYALLQNLLSPVAPTTKMLAEIVEVLNTHFDPAPSIIVERYKFNSRVAKYCSYGPSLDEMIRNQIVCGIQDVVIQRELFKGKVS